MQKYKQNRENRRFAGRGKSPISMSGTADNPSQSPGAVLGKLEKARDALGVLVAKFVKHLGDKTLPEKKSMSDKEEQTYLLTEIPVRAGELNKLNTEEGSMALFTTCLNSIIYLRNEANKAHFQNLQLYKKLNVLTERLDALETNAIKDKQEVEIDFNEDQQQDIKGVESSTVSG